MGFPAAQEGRRSLRRPGPSGRAYSYDSSVQTGCRPRDPAGARDAEDVDTSVTAKRELEEETGYSIEEILPLVKNQTAVAYCNEYTDIYLARNLQPIGDQHLDEAEEIKVEAFEKEELLRRIYAGEIRDAKTVAGIMAYAAMGSLRE